LVATKGKIRLRGGKKRLNHREGRSEKCKGPTQFQKQTDLRGGRKEKRKERRKTKNNM